MAHQKNLLMRSEFLQPAASDLRMSGPVDMQVKRRVSRAEARSAASDERSEARWSPRRTVAFIVVTNGAFWAAVAAGVWALTHR